MPNPQPEDYAAEIEISPDKKFLYASNRRSDGNKGSIVVFSIGSDGDLNRIQVQSVIGATPRHFKVKTFKF